MSHPVDRKRLLTAAILLMGFMPLLSAASGPGQSSNVNQVRVTAERASIYIEPNRGSTRIDIVTKGALLNLLQTKKVNDVWYHVSFSSSRYGTRISGFILDSTVELIGETPPPAEEKKTQEKAQVREAAPQKAEEEGLVKPEPPAEKAPEKAALKSPVPPAVSESLILTPPLKGRTYPFPLTAAALEERPWRVEGKILAEKAEMAAEFEVSIPPTPLPTQREIVVPSAEAPLQDAAWKERAPAEPEKAQAALQPGAPPATPAPKEKEPETAKPKSEPVKPQAIKPPRSPAQRRGPGRMSLSLGYGSSFGGAGACFQFKAAKAFAVHAGAGIFPTTLIYSETDWVQNKPLWSVGIKYYLPFDSPPFYPYLDVQYGGLRVEAAQVVIGIWDYDYIYSQEQKTLWGPSLLGGIEVRKGRFGLSGALGISYVTTSWEMLQSRVSLALDISLMVHF